MAQKSGIDMIEEILERIQLLDRRFIVVEQNTKELLNRANSFQQVENKREISVPSIQGIGESMPANISSMGGDGKVVGRIRKKGKYIVGAQVTIIDENGNEVKKTKTNKAGEWMCSLSPGSYKAKYFLEKVVNKTISFKVNPDQTLTRVAQPK